MTIKPTSQKQLTRELLKIARELSPIEKREFREALLRFAEGKNYTPEVPTYK